MTNEDLVNLEVQCSPMQCTAHVSKDLASSQFVHVDQSLAIIVGEGIRLDEDVSFRSVQEEESNEGQGRSIASRLISMYEACSEPTHFLSEIIGSWSLFIYHKGRILVARGSDGAQDLYYSISADGGQIVTFSNSLDHLNHEGETYTLKPGHYCISGKIKGISTYQFALSPCELDERIRQDESNYFSESDDDNLECSGTSSAPPNHSPGISGLIRNISQKIKEKLSLSPPVG